MSIPTAKPQACLIWMHGLGASASDMQGVAAQPAIKNLPLQHVFLDAPKRPVTINGGMVMPAWYDIVGTSLTDREDRQGIENSEALIKQAIQKAISIGFASQHIILAGFSQGGAMALHTALNTDLPLGGVIALSAYLPLSSERSAIQEKSTPFFIAAGQWDTIVFPQWTEQSRAYLQQQGYTNLSYHQYPMEHNLCFEEIRDLALWLQTHILVGADI